MFRLSHLSFKKVHRECVLDRSGHCRLRCTTEADQSNPTEDSHLPENMNDETVEGIGMKNWPPNDIRIVPGGLYLTKNLGALFFIETISEDSLIVHHDL